MKCNDSSWFCNINLLILGVVSNFAAISCTTHRTEPTFALLWLVWYALYRWEWLWVGGSPDPFHQRLSLKWMDMAEQASRVYYFLKTNLYLKNLNNAIINQSIINTNMCWKKLLTHFCTNIFSFTKKWSVSRLEKHDRYIHILYIS